MKFGFGVTWAKGLVFGIRHFQPEKYAPYYEIQFFLGLIQIFIIIDNGNTNNNIN
tara:strand:- start:659 stop:823 length:165 start_codon:yes stop_codon:yes gene_type:complete